MKRIMCVVLALMLVSGTAAFAASAAQQITVYPNTARISVDGVIISEDNFNYNGTLYVPLRAVSTYLGADVEWDNSSKTAFITQPVATSSPDTVKTITFLDDYNRVREVAEAMVRYSDLALVVYNAQNTARTNDQVNMLNDSLVFKRLMVNSLQDGNITSLSASFLVEDLAEILLLSEKNLALYDERPKTLAEANAAWETESDIIKILHKMLDESINPEINSLIKSLENQN